MRMRKRSKLLRPHAQGRERRIVPPVTKVATHRGPPKFRLTLGPNTHDLIRLTPYRGGFLSLVRDAIGDCSNDRPWC